ncbi:hypothetical protein ABT112_25245 [Streptomyces sp. NPDC002055]|uniref:hypothetical protein n=1 Tax=Streptomyces sp. NPDC002055 TaxID=3154534 RepID=UPI003316F3B5
MGSTGFFESGKPVLLHYDGTRWSKVAVPGVGAARAGLKDVVAGPGGQLWAVGEIQAPDKSWKALALHYNGRKWTEVPLPNGTGRLGSVTVSRGEPVVLEEKTEETSAALRYTGRKWVSMKLPADGAEPLAASAVSASGRTVDVVGYRPATGSQYVGPGAVLTARR